MSLHDAEFARITRISPTIIVAGTTEYAHEMGMKVLIQIENDPRRTVTVTLNMADVRDIAGQMNRFLRSQGCEIE